MTVRDLIIKLLDCNLDAEAMFELTFDDEGDSEWIEINGVIPVPNADDPNEFPVILLSEDIPEVERQINLN